MSKAIGEINELIMKVQKLQNNPVIDPQDWDSADLVQELLNIRLTIEEEADYRNERY